MDMKPVLSCYKGFLLFIEFWGQEIQATAIPNGEVVIGVILQGRCDSKEGRGGKGVEGNVGGPVCLHDGNNLGGEAQVMITE